MLLSAFHNYGPFQNIQFWLPAMLQVQVVATSIKLCCVFFFIMGSSDHIMVIMLQRISNGTNDSELFC
jgi:hypothetical protein